MEEIEMLLALLRFLIFLFDLILEHIRLFEYLPFNQFIHKGLPSLLLFLILLYLSLQLLQFLLVFALLLLLQLMQEVVVQWLNHLIFLPKYILLVDTQVDLYSFVGLKKHTFRQHLFKLLRLFIGLHYFTHIRLRVKRFIQIFTVLSCFIFLNLAPVQKAVKFPLPILYGKLHTFEPFLKDCLVIKADMDGPRFFMRVVVDGFQDEGEVIFLLGESQEIVLKLIEFDFDLSLCKHDMLVLIKADYFLFPTLYAEAP